MGKQHNSFKKDMDLLSEAYGSMLGGAHVSMGGLAQQAASHMRDEDGEDKTGHLSDEDLLDKVEQMGTAGDRLIDAAREQIKKEGSLTAHERDALARDAYEGEEWDQEDDYEKRMDTEAEAADPEFKPGSPAH